MRKSVTKTINWDNCKIEIIVKGEIKCFTMALLNLVSFNGQMNTNEFDFILSTIPF